MATRQKTRKKRVYKKNKYGGTTWAESAMVAGALYGVGHPREGRIMSKPDALQVKIPVPGFLTKTMIKDWHAAVPDGSITKSTKRYKGALKHLKSQSKGLAARRAKVRETKGRSPWKRSKAFKSKLKSSKSKAKKSGKKAPKAGKPYRRVHLKRGQSIDPALAEALIEAGFAGKPSARGKKKGVKVKLNPKRRKSAKKKKAGTRRKRGPGGRFKKNPKRKTAKRKKAKKKTARKKTAKKKTTRKKAKRKTKRSPKKARTAKGRFKKAKRNPKKATNRKKGKKKKYAVAKYKRNPGVMTALKAQWTKFTAAPIWITAVHATAGMGGTIVMDHYLHMAPWVPMGLKRRGLPSLALTAGSGLLVSTGAILLEGLVAKHVKSPIVQKATQNLGTNVLVGSLVTVLVKAAYELMPGQAAKYGVPRVESGRAFAAVPGGVDGLGYQDGPDYRYGFGSVESPEDLVAGESLARQVNEFHGMGQGGTPVPIEDIKGMGDWMELSGYPGQYGGGYGGMGGGSGMGDWVELEPNAPIVEHGFSPAVENF